MKRTMLANQVQKPIQVFRPSCFFLERLKDIFVCFDGKLIDCGGGNVEIDDVCLW